MSFDWIRNPDLPVSAYCQRLRKHNWLPTILGPLEGWPALLRQQALQIMVNPAPRIICWGEELALIYNEAALPLVQVMGKHPEQLGQPTSLFWSELIEQGVRAMFDEVMNHGRPVVLENHYFALPKPGSSSTGIPVSTASDRHEDQTHQSEEGYYDMNLLPIFDAEGGVAGVLYEGMETTSYVIAERQLSTILCIEDSSSEVTSLSEVWEAMLNGLNRNVQDVPFAFLYSRTKIASEGPTTDRVSLEGSIGLPSDHPLAQLDSPNTSLTAFIEQVLTSGEPMMVNCSDLIWQSGRPSGSEQTGQSNSFPSDEGANFSTCCGSPAFLRLSKSRSGSTETMAPRHQPFVIHGRGFDQQVESALILPIPRLGGSEPVVILVLGMNPQRPYDQLYQQWIRQLTESLIRIVASISVPEESRRQQIATQQMAREHARITSVLTGRKREEEMTATTLKRIADMAPVGMCMFRPDGSRIWSNQEYAEHLRLPPEVIDLATVKTNIHPDDQWVVDDVKEGKTLPLVEMRIMRGTPDPNFEPLPGDDGYNWIMAAPQLMYDELGNIESVFGWTLDITHKKRAERLQAQRLQDQSQRIQDILEAKRQSENFIDMTSHEMRNPLSAIIQSAEFIISIIESAADITKGEADHKAILESAEVINLCAQHQKRIVDDLLTLSKLDAKLLHISQEKVDPTSILEKMAQMYDGELKNADIETELLVDRSLNDMAVDRVILDPSRLLQVLINMFTNAIKFTKDSPRRKITLTLSSSYTRPVYGPYGGSYVPFHSPSQPSPSRGEEGLSGQPPRNSLFLQFAVEDTGRGLSLDEIGALFQRFSQASPKTYGKYGGSGLGLFISRELIELQGGQIGVHSNAEEGTTFFCYVECKRHHPDPGTNQLRRRSTGFDITQEVKRHKSDALLTGYETETPSPDTPDTPDSPDTQLHSILDLSSMPPPSPIEEFLPPKQLGVIHVLIVEDNKINQKVLSQQLKREGCITHVADHGGQALDFLLQSTFAIPQPFFVDVQKYTTCHVVLLDVEMPVMDGLTAARRVRELEREGKLRRHIPIIAVTANARAEQRGGALEAGMNSVITKPFRIPDLMEKMKFWILETDARRVEEWRSSTGR